MSTNVPVMLHITALEQVMKFVKTRMVLICAFARMVLMVNPAQVSCNNYYYAFMLI